jgi:hypothetical protein
MKRKVRQETGERLVDSLDYRLEEQFFSRMVLNSGDIENGYFPSRSKICVWSASYILLFSITPSIPRKSYCDIRSRSAIQAEGVESAVG